MSTDTRLKVYLDFADWWVGVYICLLPCVVIRYITRKGIRREELLRQFAPPQPSGDSHG